MNRKLLTEGPHSHAAATGVWRGGYYMRVVPMLMLAYVLAGTLLDTSVVQWLCTAFARAAAGLASVLGSQAIVVATKIIVEGGALGLEITPECAGLYSLFWLLCMLWAVRQPISRRAIWSVLLVTTWACVVILRLASLALWATASLERFQLAHDWLWPPLSGLFAGALFVVCRKWDAHTAK